jgi:hypothetical protein
MDSNKQKHLEMIQSVISRMGGNLFYLRGWSITLAAGLLALLSQKDHPRIFPLIILAAATIIFWIYDGYFLAQERRYRDLYEKVRNLDDKDVDFSMNASDFAQYKKNTLVYCMGSRALAPFYVFLLAATGYLIASTR